ncbi:MAG: hypothetical protein A3K61_01995 [Thaumarchaeota archaeon RBG_16_49_8]|nr:MAG: hypothetical protein A3K61_01995 [Thaumarchaeota archaeon RBG_16_49_8]
MSPPQILRKLMRIRSPQNRPSKIKPLLTRQIIQNIPRMPPTTTITTSRRLLLPFTRGIFPAHLKTETKQQL